MSKCTEGVMYSLYLCNQDVVHQCIKELDVEERVWVACVNGSRSVVVAGYEYEIERVIDGLKQKGKRINSKRLNTSGPFHTPLMRDATMAFRDCKELIEKSINVDSESSLKYCSSISGKIEDANDKEMVCKLLLDQIESPVQWYQALCTSMDYIRDHNNSDNIEFIEIGPGSQLTSMLRGFQCTSQSIDTVSDIESFLKQEVPNS